MVGRDGDIASGHQFIIISVIQPERDTALGIAGGDHKRRGFHELEFQLRATGCGPPRTEGRVDVSGCVAGATASSSKGLTMQSWTFSEFE